MNEDKTTTWGDCPTQGCPFYGRLQYGIEPGDYCGQKREDKGLDADDYCGEELRWWDRWHNGKHSWRADTGIAKCVEQRRTDAMRPHTDDMVVLVSDIGKVLTTN